jgi:hypothetical protein
MDRFTEQIHPSNAYLANCSGDDDITAYFEPLRCGSCAATVTELSPCTWDTSLMVGACCAVDLELEPECSCRQTDVDMFDPRGCPYHDAMSPWNVRLRAVTAVQRYQQDQKELTA